MVYGVSHTHLLMRVVRLFIPCPPCVPAIVIAVIPYQTQPDSCSSFSTLLQGPTRRVSADPSPVSGSCST